MQNAFISMTHLTVKKKIKKILLNFPWKVTEYFLYKYRTSRNYFIDESFRYSSQKRQYYFFGNFREFCWSTWNSSDCKLVQLEVKKKNLENFSEFFDYFFSYRPRPAEDLSSFRGNCVNLKRLVAEECSLEISKFFRALAGR